MPWKLKIPPGVVLTDSPTAAEGRFIGGNLMRFIGRYAEKWLGWAKIAVAQLDGAPRGSTAWASTSGDYNIAVGTFRRAYVITGGDTLLDVTPIRESGTLGTDPFAVTDGSAIVVVTDTGHGLAQGAIVEFTGATAGGGITIDGEYTVTEVIDANSYKITHSAPGTSTDATTGGAAVDYVYRINPGNRHPTVGTGWSTGGWSGSGGWGEPTSGGSPEDMRHWSFQPYGNNLLGAPFGGTLYRWVEGSDTELEAVANAPEYMRSMFVTGERFIFALGTDTGAGVDPMRINWPDQDDLTDWTPSDTNTANERRLQYGSKLIAGTTLANKENLIWTDAGLYVFQYDGSDFLFADRLVGKNCGLCGPLAFCEVNNIVYWMSGFGFHYYNGGVLDIPNQDDVLDFIFGDMDPDMISKTKAQYNPKNGTVMFFYVSTASADQEPDKCAEVNISNWAWSPVHDIRRCEGTIVNPAIAQLVLFDPDGYTFEHEVGVDGDDQDGEAQAIEAYITFGDYELNDGDNFDAMGFIPDFQRQAGTIEVALYTKDRPNDADSFDEQTVMVAEGEGIVDCRISGRLMGGTIRTFELGGDLRLGICQLEDNEAGSRR